MDLIKELVSAQDEMASWRRHLHQNPELAYEEKDTSDFVAAKLEGFGIEVHRGLGGTGVVGVIHGRKGKSGKGKAIGLRADMDALPMDEETNLPYASARPGKMHACGHDGHTTMLLGAAKHLAETRNFEGTVYCVFQPAEEGGAGAKAMMDDGLFEKFPMDSVWGVHNLPGLGVGRAIAHLGPAMASADFFTITIEGKGGHAAQPHLTSDPVVATAMVVTALQTLVSRQLDPADQAVLSITMMNAGSAKNIIPARATIVGTLRTMKDQTRKRMLAEIESVAKSSAAAARCETVTEVEPGGYPPTINHESEALFARNVITGMLGEDGLDTSTDPLMGAEDFAFMLEDKEGAYVMLGAGEDVANLHSPHYDFNDDLLTVGASYWVRLAEAKLAA